MMEMQMARLVRSSALAVCVFLFGGLAHAGRLAYRVQLLPTPENCDAYSQWHGLGHDGAAAGILVCDGGPAFQAVAWNGSEVTELPTLGGPSATPYGVGRDGLIVGMAETPETYDSESHVQRPVVWDAGTVRDLETLGGPLGAATAINASGMIVGVSQPATDDPSLGRKPVRACVWDAWSIRDIGDLGGPEAFAHDVNDRGWVVGNSTTRIRLGAWFEEHAFLYDGHSMRDLGTLGGPVSLAWAINSNGDVVGYSYPATPAPELLSWHAFVWHRGTMIDLGTLGGQFSEALDINDRGDIVGWSRLGNSVDHAVLWRWGQLLDLNAVVPGDTECVLTRATAINDQGQILADASCDGRPRVALLTPTAGVRSPGAR